MNFDKQPSISDLTTSLVTIAENFEFLSSLKENENLQKTTTSRVLGRAVFGYKQNPIQKTLDLGIGIYAKFSDAYGKESFDAVITHYRSETYSASLVFDNTILSIQAFDKIEEPIGRKIKLTLSGKSAFWHLAASRIGFHQWAKTLSLYFKNSAAEDIEYRLKEINTSIMQQNSVIVNIFKKCLCHFPKAIKALALNFDPISKPFADTIPKVMGTLESFCLAGQEHVAAIKNMNALIAVTMHFEAESKEQWHFKKSVQEFIRSIAVDFVDQLENYEHELLSQEKDNFLEERLQINAYKLLLPKALKFKQSFNYLPSETFDDSLKIVDLLHDFFISQNEGKDVLAHIISAAIDINETKDHISKLIDSEMHKLFPKSTLTLWQQLALERISSGFLNNLNEMSKFLKIIPFMQEYSTKIEGIMDLFKLTACFVIK